MRQPSKGPWSVKFLDVVVDADGFDVCEVRTRNDDTLIAAAPELLALARVVAEAYLTEPGEPWGFCSISEHTRATAEALVRRVLGDM